MLCCCVWACVVVSGSFGWWSLYRFPSPPLGWRFVLSLFDATYCLLSHVGDDELPSPSSTLGDDDYIFFSLSLSFLGSFVWRPSSLFWWRILSLPVMVFLFPLLSLVVVFPFPVAILVWRPSLLSFELWLPSLSPVRVLWAVVGFPLLSWGGGTPSPWWSRHQCARVTIRPKTLGNQGCPRHQDSTGGWHWALRSKTCVFNVDLYLHN